eukprot:7381215-Prymnesium_polylepis.1
MSIFLTERSTLRTNIEDIRRLSTLGESRVAVHVASANGRSRLLSDRTDASESRAPADGCGVGGSEGERTIGARAVVLSSLSPVGGRPGYGEPPAADSRSGGLAGTCSCTEPRRTAFSADGGAAAAPG